MKRVGLKKRSLLLTITLVATAILTTACQATPNMQNIVGINDDRMEQILVQQDHKQYPFVAIDAPEHVGTNYEEYGKMKLAFDADIIMPETTAYPVIEVTRRTISDEDFLDLIELFAGSNNEMYSKWELSKQDWLDKQNEYKTKDPEGVLSENYMQYLQQKYNEAEKEVQNPLITLADSSTNLPSKIFVKQENGTIGYFYLSKFSNNFTYFRDVDLEQCPASIYKDEYFDENLDTIEQFYWRQPKEPEISQADAYAQALKYIDALEIDLELYKAETCTFLDNVVNKSVGWNFTFTRKIANAQARYDLSGFGIDPKSMPSYGAPWDIEVCTIGIDNSGLCFLEYKGASQISKEIRNTAELEQFEIIQERIANQLNYIYGTVTRDNDVGVEIIVSKIELGISLVSIQNETKTGLYIPTWYVDYYIKWSDAEDEVGNGELNTIIFNAIDGSYIEPRVTNEKLMSILSTE